MAQENAEKKREIFQQLKDLQRTQISLLEKIGGLQVALMEAPDPELEEFIAKCFTNSNENVKKFEEAVSHYGEKHPAAMVTVDE